MGVGKWLLALFALFILGYLILPRLWMISSITGHTIAPIMQKPKITVYDIKFQGFGIGGSNLEIILNVHNPNSLPITFDKAIFDIYINDVKVGVGKIPYQVTVPAYSDRQVSSQVSISYDGGLSGTWQYIKGKVVGEKVIIRLNGNAYVDVPVLGSIAIPFSYSEDV